MPEGTTGAAHLPNTEADKFRLRQFVEHMIEAGEIVYDAAAAPDPTPA